MVTTNRIMKKLLPILISLFLTLSSIYTPAYAEPTSGGFLIVSLRPYSGSNVVYVYTNNAPGTFCANSTYVIDLSTNGGKAMYAAALTAVATNKRVALEIANCGGGAAGGNSLQSIYILQ